MQAGLWAWLHFSTEAPHHLCRWSLWKEGVIIYPSSITSVTISLLSFSSSTIQCTAFDENITENLGVCAIYEEIILDVFHYNDTHSSCAAQTKLICLWTTPWWGARWEIRNYFYLVFWEGDEQSADLVVILAASGGALVFVLMIVLTLVFVRR